MKMEGLSDNELQVHRFFCKCGSAMHVIEFSMWEDGSFEEAFYHGGGCDRKLWDRIKMAFGLIFRKSAPSWSECIISKEDAEEISKLLASKKE